MNFRSLKGLTLYLNAFFSTILLEVDGLTAPSFISTWTLMDSTDPLSTKLTINHGLGELPVMVEVQIRSNTTGAIYPGMKSAFLSHTNTPRGGVVYNYDETSVYLYGATDYGGDPAYIIFTGSVSWTIHSQEISKIGWVRVRAWKSTNLPNPTNIDIGHVETLNIAAIRAASAFKYYHEIVHDFGIYPVLSVVQYTPSNILHPLYGIHAESQGSSSRPVGDLESTWGGLIHAVNETHLRLWAPDNLNGYLHSFCGTWGGNHSVDCAFDEATVTVKLWKTVQAPLTFNFTTMNHQGTLHPTHHYTTYPLFVFNIDTDIIVGLALVRDGPNLGFEFPGAGAAMMDDGIGVGGILYSYYEYMYELRFYHPTSTIIYMNGLANGWNTQESTVADMRFRLMMANYVPVDYCLEQFMPDFPGQNTTGNQTFQSIQPGCLVTYECLPGYELFLGSLVLFYNQHTKLWNGSEPICQVMSTTSTGSTTTLAPTTTTLAPTTTTLAPTTPTFAPTTTTLAPTTTTLAPTTTTLAPTTPTFAPTTTTLAPTTTTLAPTTTTLAPTTTTLAPTTTTTTTLAPTTTTDVTATSTDVTTTTTDITATTTDVTTTTTDVTTTTTDVITFPSSPVPINSRKCYCNNCTNISMAEIIEIAEELVVNLTVNHKNTSRYARTLVSSDDYRYSAKVIGIVGTTVCVIVATLIVLSDIASVWQPKPKGNGNGKNSQPKNV